jgi:hypothetical protein
LKIIITDVDISYGTTGAMEKFWFGVVGDISIGLQGSIRLVHPRAGHYIESHPGMNSQEVVAALRPAVDEWRRTYRDQLPPYARDMWLATRK